MEKKNRNVKYQLPFKKKLSYGVGHVLNDLCASMWFSYMLLFMHKVAAFNNINAGLLILVGQIADALATPFVGYQSDRTSNVRYGRRKIWHLFGVFCVAVSFPFIFSLCISCSTSPENARMVYYIPFIIIFQFGWASTQISHLSLIPELTICKQGKVELNAIRYFFTIMANLLVFAVCFVLFQANIGSTSASTGDPNLLCKGDAPKFQYLAICVVVVGLFFMLIFHFGVKEGQLLVSQVVSITSSDDEDEEESLIKKDDDHLYVRQKTIKDWFNTLRFYQVGWLYMMTRLIVNISQVYISYFVLETLHMEKQTIAIAPAVIYVSGIFASLIAKELNSKLGLKYTFFLGLFLIFGSCTWFYILRGVSADYRYELYGGAVLLGMGSSTLLIDSLAMISEMIGKNTDTSAFVYGSMSFLDKLSNGVAIMLVQYFHPCKNDPICCPSCQRYYGKVMVYIPGIAALLALVVLITLMKTSIGGNGDKSINEREPSYGSADSQPINSNLSTPPYEPYERKNMKT